MPETSTPIVKRRNLKKKGGGACRYSLDNNEHIIQAGTSNLPPKIPRFLEVMLHVLALPTNSAYTAVTGSYTVE